MKTVLLFFSFIIFSFSGLAQVQLQGVVNYHNQPVSGAVVRVEGLSIGTTTNAQGGYSLKLEPGDYTIVFSYGNQKRISVSIQENKTLNIDLSDASEALDEVFLSAIRVNAQSPITYSNLGQKEIENRNLGQDIPQLLNYLPGVVTTSDAGAGVGYTGIRVRGSDPTRVNVTINGIPYNDSESQGTFWVNLGDFASSVESMQLQRGVGTSTNGAGAFGASLNLRTDSYQLKPSAEIANSVGSFGTHKHTAKFSTGLFNDHFEFAGRASIIKSDGYIDRASTDLKSYFLQGTYVEGKTLVKALTFGGSERTYQAWNGIEADKMEEDRTYNSSGEYTDENGNLQYYDNQIDDFKQDHFQLLWNQEYSGGWSSNLALHYTNGLGFYESYREDANLEEYLLKNFTANGKLVETSDLVTKKWLNNDFYGTTFNVNYKNSRWDLIFGGAWNTYKNDHFGEIIYAKFTKLENPRQHYYDNTARKNDFNFFAKANWKASKKIRLFADLQVRNITYKTEGFREEKSPFNIDEEFTFFNPKAGLTYKWNPENQLYFSVARAHREPNRDDYQNGNLKPEELTDFELGWRYRSKNMEVNSNFYYMHYQNQLVLTGALDDVGSFIRQNSGNSYRSGLEVDATIRVLPKVNWRPNIAISRNKNVDFRSFWDGELQDFGDTDISFSPEIVAGSILGFRATPNFEIRLLSKYVGEQYMSNVEAESSLLDAFFTNDLNVQYSWKNAPLFREILFTGLVNNIFDVEYESNGYFYTYDVPVTDNSNAAVQTLGGAGYYPQAGINFLAGVTLKF